MESLMKADVFFFVTTISVVLITILFGVAIFYVIQILRNIKTISDIFKNGTLNAKDNLDKLIAQIMKNPIFKIIFGKSFRGSPSRRSSKGTKNTAHSE